MRVVNETKTHTGGDLTFNEACSYLGLSSHDFAALREQGLVAYTHRRERQVYPRQALELTARLLAIGQRRRWSSETLVWYADLAFASQVGRVVLLPLAEGDTPAPSAGASSWLGTPHVAAVLRDIEHDETILDEPISSICRSLVTASVGPDLFWEDQTALRRSPIDPIITYLEGRGFTVRRQASRNAGADAGQPFALLVLAFATLAQPISTELRRIVQATYTKLRGVSEASVPVEDQKRILREQLIAVDKLYASKATEIHSPARDFDVNLGVLTTQKRTIALQFRLPLEREDALDNILDIIRPYLGTYGARVVQSFYEIANDPPYWRSPVITLDTNDLLDRLGEKRDTRGIHYSRNRARLRDTLNAAHNLEIVGEYTTWENGTQVRKAIRRSVLSLIGATFDANETSDLTTEDLFLKGLPKTMQVRLNYYDGVRQPDGTLGNQYVLLPRLAEPKTLPKANYATTHERLRQHLLYQLRQTKPDPPELAITRALAMEKSGITNKNVTRATQTLEKALNRLIEEGTLTGFTPIPHAAAHTFTIVFAQDVAARVAD
jgi:hypothetical protein